MEKDTQSCKYQLTINNPGKDMTHKKIKTILLKNFKTFVYAAMCDEIGESKTPHTHVFCCFGSRVRFSTIKRNFPQAHIEVAKGTISVNIDYLKKTGKWADTDKAETSVEGTFEEIGSRPPDSRGQREDMSELYQMIQDGMTNSEIIAVNQDYILQIDKLDKVRTMLLTEKFKDTVRTDLEVTYISGPTVTGKTREVLESNGYPNVYRVTDYQHPFDGYACQPVICFDEFRSSLKLKEMLNYCDIYPIELPSRYTNKFACYNKVYIVSNWALEKQYSELQRTDKESWEAFLRRIKKVIVYEDINKYIIYDSIKEYQNRDDFKALTPEEAAQLPFAI